MVAALTPHPGVGVGGTCWYFNRGWDRPRYAASDFCGVGVIS
jgi:hypothetical protein